jgi:hypothetical protein
MKVAQAAKERGRGGEWGVKVKLKSAQMMKIHERGEKK